MLLAIPNGKLSFFAWPYSAFNWNVLLWVVGIIINCVKHLCCILELKGFFSYGHEIIYSDGSPKFRPYGTNKQYRFNSQKVL